MRPFELRDARVLLAVPTPDDIDVITEACQDHEVLRWTTMPAPYTRADAEAFVHRLVPAGWASEQELTWAIRDPESRGVVGMIGLRALGEGFGEMGFWLSAPARGRGLASRSLRLTASFALDPEEGLGFRYLRWRAFVGNWPSRRVAWSCGFRMEGQVRGELSQRGERRDAWIATLAAGEPMRPVAPWLDVPVLRGERVTLRPFAESDAEAVAEACSDPITQHWLSSLPSPYTPETALAHIRSRAEEAASGRGAHWAAAPPAGGPAVGAFSLMDLPRHDGGAEVGYWLHPAARGGGAATEAVTLMSQHAFADPAAGGLGLRRLVVAHLDGNDASGRVIERCGFRPCGVERAAGRLRGGAIVDVHWHDLLCDD